MIFIKKLRRISQPRLKYFVPAWEDIKLSYLEDQTYKNQSTQIILSQHIQNYFGFNPDNHIFLFSSARSGIEFVLKALAKKSPHKNEVILPSYACKALFDTVKNNDLVPVFVDVNASLLPDGEKLTSLINNKTLACFFHNLAGRDNYCPHVLKVCTRYNTVIIDDHAQSFFLKKRSHPLLITVFSFAFSKTISSTAGGALVVNSHMLELMKDYERLLEDDMQDAFLRLKLLSKKSFSPYYKFMHRLLGDFPINGIPQRHYQIKKISRLDSFIAISQLYKAQQIEEALKNHYSLFAKAIEAKIGPGLYIFNGNHSSESLLLHFKGNKDKMAFYRHFSCRNIELQEMYTPLHLRYDIRSGRLEMTEKFYENVLNFPIRSNLLLTEKKRLLEALEAL